MTTDIKPNTTEGAATDSPAVPSLDAIAQKMTAMREQTVRNQLRATEQTATGQDEEADPSSPVAPNDEVGAEVADASDASVVDGDQEPEAQAEEPVSTDSNDSSAEELIDFI